MLRKFLPRLQNVVRSSLNAPTATKRYLWSSRTMHSEEESSYDNHRTNTEVALNNALTDSKRFQHINDRLEHSDHSIDSIRRQCKARYFNRYRGCFLMKSPEDILIYQQLFETIKPRTILELGTYSGASALWMANYMSLLPDAAECQVYSVDVDMSYIDDYINKVKPSNLHFIQGDCYNISSVFDHNFLSTMTHPVVVIDDVHVNTRGILDYIHPYLQTGDYIIPEDTHPALPKHLGACAYVSEYELWLSSRPAEVKKFLKDYDLVYAIDSFFADMFGYNYSWNTWIRKVK